MKKSFFLVLAVLAMLSAFSVALVSAQDEEAEALPSCSPEDYAADITAIDEAFAGLGELTAIPEEPTPSDFSLAVAAMDAFAYAYWEGLAENIDNIGCAEELFIFRTAGLTFDEVLISLELSALAVHEEAAGNSDAAAILLEQSEARIESLQAQLESVQAITAALVAGEAVEIQAEYPACTEEEYTATLDGLTAVNETYIEFGTAMEEGATGLDLTALVAGMNELSVGYWADFYTVLPACYEAQEIGYNYGLIIDESLILVGLARLSELEFEAGNDELGQVLADSVEVRVEGLTAMSEEFFGTEEEE